MLSYERPSLKEQVQYRLELDPYKSEHKGLWRRRLDRRSIGMATMRRQGR